MAYIATEQQGEQKIPSKSTWNSLSLNDLYNIENNLLNIIYDAGNPNVQKAYQIHLNSLRELIKIKEYQETLSSEEE